MAMTYLSQLVVLFAIAVNWTSAQGQNGQGQWGPWSEVSACSVTCGYGTQQKTRVWMQTRDSPGGKPFTNTESFTCSSSEHPGCPVDGVWSEWFPVGSCSKMCGGGTRRRERECIGVNWGGKTCEGEKEKTAKCGAEPCPRLPANFDLSQCVEGKNFTCASSQMCVPGKQRCDGPLHCHDGSDEKGCKSRFGYSIRGGGAGLDMSHFVVSAAFTIFVILLLH